MSPTQQCSAAAGPCTCCCRRQSFWNAAIHLHPHLPLLLGCRHALSVRHPALLDEVVLLFGCLWLIFAVAVS